MMWSKQVLFACVSFVCLHESQQEILYLKTYTDKLKLSTICMARHSKGCAGTLGLQMSLLSTVLRHSWKSKCDFD